MLIRQNRTVRRFDKRQHLSEMVEIVVHRQYGQLHGRKSAHSDPTMPDSKSLPSHRDRTALPSISSLNCSGGKVRILALPELLKNPDSDFLGRRAASLSKLAPEPNKFLLLRFVHGNPPLRIQNI